MQGLKNLVGLITLVTTIWALRDHLTLVAAVATTIALLFSACWAGVFILAEYNKALLLRPHSQQPQLINKIVPQEPESLPFPNVILPVVTPFRTFPSKVDLISELLNSKRTGRLDQNNQDILLGTMENGAPMIIPVQDVMHTGLLGSTGSGKSSLQRSILTQLYLADPSGRKVEFNLFDLEGRELRLFKGVPNTTFYTEDERVSAARITDLRALVDNMCRLSEEEIEAQPHRLVIIEELLDFLDALTPKAKDDLDIILRRGRKCRIYVMGASQVFQTGNVGKFVKQMMTTRCCFRTERESASAFGFDPKPIAAIDVPGRFAYRTPLGRGMAQAPFISTEQVKALLPPNWAELAARHDRQPEQVVEYVQPVMDEEDDEPWLGSQSSSELFARKAWAAGARTIPGLIKAGLSQHYAKKFRLQFVTEEAEGTFFIPR